MNWQERINVDPLIFHCHECVAGTRIMVSVALDNLAAGLSKEEILKCYPSLRNVDIDACLAYAAELTRRGDVTPPPKDD